MQLDAMTTAVRPRNDWEAMDLGIMLVRQHWWTIMSAWLVIVGPIAAVLCILFREDLWIALLIHWWLKPAYDRVVLFILSRALFGAVPRLIDTLGELPKLMTTTGLLWNLTLLRFDFTRSFNLPVWQLEKLHGPMRRTRQHVLQKRARGRAVWLTVAGIHIEMLLQLSLLVLFLQTLPEPVDFDWQAVLTGEQYGFLLGWFGHLCGVLMVALVEPFYVGAGFSLYLNRRVHLEGWDLELIFRRMAQRLKHERLSLGPVVTGLLAACLLVSGLLQPLPLQATETEALSFQEQHKTLIKQVLEEEDFNRYKERSSWRYQGGQEDKTSDRQELSSLLKFVARFYEAVLWILGIFLVIWLVSNHRRWSEFLSKSPVVKTDAKPTESLFGMDVRPESLPADVPGHALRLWQQDDADGALSLLYRGALAALMNRQGLALNDSATEGDCVLLVAQRTPKALEVYFRQLTDAWIRTAYAHRPPASTTFERLCTDWTGHFGIPR
jgi:hypothetical protein